MRTGEKSYFLVYMFTSIIAGMGLVLALLVSVLRKRIENTAIGGRIDETIEIIDEKLFYTFRIKFQSLSNQRNLVVIDLNTINNLKYEDQINRVCIEGKMLEKIVDLSTNIHRINSQEMVDSKIYIFDYFSPSLYELLKTKVR